MRSSLDWYLQTISYWSCQSEENYAHTGKTDVWKQNYAFKFTIMFPNKKLCFRNTVTEFRWLESFCSNEPNVTVFCDACKKTTWLQYVIILFPIVHSKILDWWYKNRLPQKANSQIRMSVSVNFWDNLSPVFQ